MGQEESTPSAPPMPSKLTLDDIAVIITSPTTPHARILVLTGAGISTSAGIPDFRSPKTGLYATLSRLSLPYAEAVFDLSYFRQNPAPFYALAHELFPDRAKFRPTLAHAFVSLLADKQRLLMCMTQNIDTLERQAGVPEELLMEAHGSFASQQCIECGLAYPYDEMQKSIVQQTIPHCESCGGLVKPNIVFFGESLPPRFFQTSQHCLPQTDLLIIMGSSLVVQPFASLPFMLPNSVPRLLINNEPVGGLGGRPRDVILLGDCDQGVRKLAKACGWEDELLKKWKGLNGKGEGSESGQAVAASSTVTSPDHDFEAKLDKLTKEIDQRLKIAERHKVDVEAYLGTQFKQMNLQEQNNLRHVFPHMYH